MRRHRWEQPFNIRPAQRSMSSRAKRARYTWDDMGSSIDACLESGEIVGRAYGRRDTFKELAELIDDPIELAAAVGGERLVEQLDLFLIVLDDPQGWLRDPERWSHDRHHDDEQDGGG